MLTEDKSKGITRDQENEDENIDLDELEKTSGGTGASRRGKGILTPEI